MTHSKKYTERGQAMWRWMRRMLLVGGIALIALVAAAGLEHSLRERSALQAFAKTETSAAEYPAGAGEPTGLARSGLVEQASPAAKHDPVARDPETTLAVLEIPSIRLVAPVLDGTDAWTLNHGVGRIQGTAMPGHEGNIALAGHRDSYFRGLKHLKRGDPITLRSHGGLDTYVVNGLEVVYPENVRVLKATENPSLTLVTCYPFHFFGSAPQRFVVTAYRTHHATVGLKATDTRPIPQSSSSTQEEP